MISIGVRDQDFFMIFDAIQYQDSIIRSGIECDFNGIINNSYVNLNGIAYIPI